MHTMLIGVQEEHIESTANKLDGQCTVIETRHLWVKSIQGNNGTFSHALPDYLARLLTCKGNVTNIVKTN